MTSPQSPADARVRPPEEAEEKLSQLLMEYAGPRAWEHRHPLIALRAASLLRHLPVQTYTPSASRDGQYIGARLDRSDLGVATILHQAVALLEVDDGDGRQLANKSARKHARRALRAGVTWSRVTEKAEKERFLALARDSEPFRHRGQDRPMITDFDALTESGLWLAAWLGESPLLLSVTAVDGHWAMMRYFCSFEATRTAASARYLMTRVLAEELSSAGVRFMCDSVSPFRLAAGPRQFSRMVGFRIHRVQVRTQGR